MQLSIFTLKDIPAMVLHRRRDAVEMKNQSTKETEENYHAGTPDRGARDFQEQCCSDQTLAHSKGGTEMATHSPPLDPWTTGRR